MVFLFIYVLKHRLLIFDIGLHGVDKETSPMVYIKLYVCQRYNSGPVKDYSPQSLPIFLILI